MSSKNFPHPSICPRPSISVRPFQSIRTPVPFRQRESLSVPSVVPVSHSPSFPVRPPRPSLSLCPSLLSERQMDRQYVLSIRVRSPPPSVRPSCRHPRQSFPTHTCPSTPVPSLSFCPSPSDRQTDGHTVNPSVSVHALRLSVLNLKKANDILFVLVQIDFF